VDETFFVNLEHARIRVRVVGGGERTLVIVPDPPNLIEHHQEVIARLADTFRIICFELPGFGHSKPLGGACFELDAQAEWMGEVLERLSARRVILEMSCLGALVGIRLAHRRPDIVDRLVLAQVSTLAQMQAWARGTDVCHLIHTRGVGQALVALFRRFIVRHWYRVALPEGTDARTRQRYLRPALQSLREGASFELASAYQAIHRATDMDWGAISQPTLLLWGRADRTHEGTGPQALQRVLPHAVRVEIDGCGHFPTLEDVGRYVDLLMEWERHSSRGTSAREGG
jgi:pimeloyl-ACP methyl ester carboxylesterase